MFHLIAELFLIIKRRPKQVNYLATQVKHLTSTPPFQISKTRRVIFAQLADQGPGWHN